jgi:8-oxo-dGTP pyrophosphatase MutT (NUDIX family)
MTVKRWSRLQAHLFLGFRGVRDRMTMGARGVLIDGEKILLIRHTYVPGWQFPGGGTDPGESLEQCMRREVLEEAKYKVGGRAELFGIYHNVQVTNRDHVALYLCREFERVETFQPNLEIAEMAWFDHKMLPPDVSRSTRQRVAEIFSQAEQSPNW